MPTHLTAVSILFIKRYARRLTDGRYEIGVPFVNGRYTKRTTFSVKNGFKKVAVCTGPSRMKRC